MFILGITSLLLNGFKSFGRPCEFEFSRNFTAIVGPNGSGKSNILDALKWILGEGSLSELRITRQSDLLFQGSKSISPADNAEVILRLSSEHDKSILKRIYSRESGSAIFLDGKKILLQDIDSVKERFNLSGEGFALIGQGEIAETIHQRPSERRRQLDLLFGIELYRERRKNSMDKLGESRRESERIQTLIDELNARRAEIADKVSIAVQAQGIIDNLDLLRHDYYFLRRYEKESSQSDLEIQKHIQESKLEELNEWLNIWTSGLKHYEDKIIPNDTQSSYISELDSIRLKKDSIHRKAFKLSSQVRDICSRRNALKEGLIVLISRKESLEHDAEQKRSEYEEICRTEELKQHEISERERAFNEAQQEAQIQIQRRSKITGMIAGLKTKCSRTESDIRASEASMESNLQELTRLDEEYENKQNVIKRLERQKSSLEEKFSEFTAEHRKYASNLQDTARELRESQINYTDLDRMVIPGYTAYPEAVHSLDSKEINLNFTMVADAFTCTSNEVAGAIDAYLGGRQYWIIVNTLEDARIGIEYLKNNSYGRATFLPLEKCTPKKHDPKLKKISGKTMGWATDLISCEFEWQDAIYHLIGDLLIVEDYDTAVKHLNKGLKCPVVTADGEVFALSGTVSGGRVAHRRLGKIVAKQRHEELRAEVRYLGEKISRLQVKYEEYAKAEKDLRTKCEETKDSLERVVFDLNYEQRNLNIIAENTERIKSEYVKSESCIESLRKEYETSKHELESLEHELEALQDIREYSYEAVILPMKNELKLIRERAKLSKALLDHVMNEYNSVCSGITKTETEISSGIITEQDNRKILRELSQDKKQAYLEEQRIHAEILKYQTEFSKLNIRRERIRLRLGRSNERVLSHKNMIAEIENKISHVQSEIIGLSELWEEKYPYNIEEAKSIEGGREITSSLRKLERELKALGSYDLGALSEDISLSERIDFLSIQLEDVRTASEELLALIRDTDTLVEEKFTGAMSAIDERFNALFQRLFGGGEARLKLQDGESIWDRGVEIFARPPGKKLQNISQLSGGEQSLTSIALIFATLEAAGTPLAVLDEVDAALDEYNLIRFADLAKEYSESIQIIAMTHRRATMERADLIYGVTMIEPGLSATIGIDPNNYV